MKNVNEGLYKKGRVVIMKKKGIKSLVVVMAVALAVVAGVFATKGIVSKASSAQLQVTEIYGDVQSPCTVGTTVKLKFRTANEAAYRYNTNNFTIEKDGESFTVSGGMGRSYSWTPSEAGVYNITVYVCDYTGNSGSKTIQYSVVDSQSSDDVDVNKSNVATVYYNADAYGWENVNIHYQVGNGNWTEVPGVQMTATEDVEGYTHVYTIDLVNDDTATVCFNDGNGNWDSVYGENYTVKAGVNYIN